MSSSCGMEADVAKAARCEMAAAAAAEVVRNLRRVVRGIIRAPWRANRGGQVLGLISIRDEILF